MVLRVWPAEAPLLPPQERSHATSSWRLAVVVSAKVSKRAVQRNRLRRLLQSHLLEQPIASPQPIWLLISLKPGSPDLPPEQLLGECRHLLHKAGLTP
jgi:ribonuclease P protein component